ncbi:MAG: substrate-binding domain-containing protein [Pseudolabrys sp.]|nr:substrate-binding domain-containing protein [Pseudolabrys sp.]
MRASFSKLAIAVGLAFPLMAANGANAETLRLAGTGGIIEAMRQVAPQFKAATGIELQVIVGLGTSGAMRAIADGKIDVVAAGLPLNSEQTKGSLVSHPFARTPMVLITSHPKPNGIKAADIATIVAAENPKWEDGTPLRLILRTKVDSDSATIERLIPGVKDADTRARLRPDIPVAATDQDNVELAQRLPGSFGLAGYGQIVAEKCDLRVVPIDGIVPSLKTLEDGSYRYEKKFYLVFPRDRNAGAEKLLQFLRSDAGRQALLATGNLPVGE